MTKKSLASEQKNAPVHPEKINEFESLGLPESVFAGILDAGFEKMTPIQSRSLPITLDGSDLCGQAQTGTGKTAAFLITIFAKLHREKPENRQIPKALILAPTRELALQTYREGKILGAHTNLVQAAIYGGEGYKHQEDKLRAGVDVVIGTPGRILDFARRRILNLSQVEYLVIDEADRLMDMGFWEELRSILRLLPQAHKRQSMLFSATLDHRAKRIALSYMNDPKDVAVKPETVAAEGIEQMIYYVEKAMKFPLLLGLLSKEEITKGLIFTNTKVVAGWLVNKLHQHDHKAALLTGDLRQTVRNRVLEKFKNGETPLLVASDVASRGLHIDDVTHIINFDVPQDPEDYVHRIGRTARAGKKGKAYTLACEEYSYSLPDIETLLGSMPPSTVSYDDDCKKDQTPDYTIGYMVRKERQRKDIKRSGPGSSQRGRPSRPPFKGGGPNRGGPSSGGPRRSSQTRSSKPRKP